MWRREARKETRTEHLSDHGLLALVARGDGEAFARLYDMYGEAAYSLALRIVRDRDLAADVVQDAFMTLWNTAEKFDPTRGAPSTWILTLTHHRAVDVVRREQRRRTEAIDETRETPDPASPAARSARPCAACPTPTAR
jgi:RNA polymerase sigma factor (sigma-70 family)